MRNLSYIIDEARTWLMLEAIIVLGCGVVVFGAGRWLVQSYFGDKQ